MRKSRKASQKEVFHKGLQCNFKGLKQAIQAYFTFPLQLPQGKIGFSKHGICFQNTVLFKNYLQCKSSKHYFIVNLVDSIVINFLERKQIEVDVLLNCFFLQKKKKCLHNKHFWCYPIFYHTELFFETYILEILGEY